LGLGKLGQYASQAGPEDAGVGARKALGSGRVEYTGKNLCASSLVHDGKVLWSRLLGTFQVQISRIQQPAGLDISHGREDVLFQVRKLLFQSGKNLAQLAAAKIATMVRLVFEQPQ